MVGQLHWALSGAPLSSARRSARDLGLTDAGEPAARRLFGRECARRLASASADQSAARLFLRRAGKLGRSGGPADVLDHLASPRHRHRFMSTTSHDVERVCDRRGNSLNFGHLGSSKVRSTSCSTATPSRSRIEPEPQQPRALDALAAAVRGQAWPARSRRSRTPSASSSTTEGRRACQSCSWSRRAASNVVDSNASGRASGTFPRLVAESGPPIARRSPSRHGTDGRGRR